MAITAAEASGDKDAPVMSVVFRYSSRVMAGFEDWANKPAETKQTERPNAMQEDRGRI